MWCAIISAAVVVHWTTTFQYWFSTIFSPSFLHVSLSSLFMFCNSLLLPHRHIYIHTPTYYTLSGWTNEQHGRMSEQSKKSQVIVLKMYVHSVAFAIYSNNTVFSRKNIHTNQTGMKTELTRYKKASHHHHEHNHSPSSLSIDQGKKVVVVLFSSFSQGYHIKSNRRRKLH